MEVFSKGNLVYVTSVILSSVVLMYGIMSFRKRDIV